MYILDNVVELVCPPSRRSDVIKLKEEKPSIRVISYSLRGLESWSDPGAEP